MSVCDIINIYGPFQIVILKELQHSDGNFDETQRIELNAVRFTLSCVGFCHVTDLVRGFSSSLCSSSKSTITI